MRILRVPVALAEFNVERRGLPHKEAERIAKQRGCLVRCSRSCEAALMRRSHPRRDDRSHQPRARTTTVTVGLLLGLLGIGLATLTPAGPQERVSAFVVCVFCGAASLANLLRNIILFVPLGFFLYHLLPRLSVAALVGVGLSATVELLQTAIPGRNPVLGDLLANSWGAVLGALAAAALVGRYGEAGRKCLFTATLSLAALAAIAPAYLLVPDLPADALFVHWTPDLGDGAYGGNILEVRLGTLSLPPGRLVDGANAAERILSGDTLVVRFRGSPPRPGRQGFLRVVQGPTGRELLTLTARGTDLLLSLPYRADRFGLARPRLVAAGVLDRVVQGQAHSVRLYLDQEGTGHVIGPAGRVTRSLGNPAMGWSLLYHPTRADADGLALLCVLWCAGLLLVPTALAPGTRTALASAATLIALLSVPPAFIPFHEPLPVSGWLAAALGGVGGLGARRINGRKTGAGW